MRENSEAKQTLSGRHFEAILVEKGWKSRETFSKMTGSCCIFGCSKRKSTHPHLTFYTFPTVKKNLARRRAWLQAIRREDLKDEQKIDNARVCSLHFVSGM